jgi:hypothetical protein
MIAFDGAVRCGRGNAAINLWLQGAMRIGARLSEADVYFSGASSSELPALLHEVRITELDGGAGSPRRYRIDSGELQIDLQARGVQLHRGAAAQLFAAVPPAPVSWPVRTAWVLLLSLLRVPGVGPLLLGRRGTV